MSSYFHSCIAAPLPPPFVKGGGAWIFELNEIWGGGGGTEIFQNQGGGEKEGAKGNF